MKKEYMVQARINGEWHPAGMPNNGSSGLIFRMKEAAAAEMMVLKANWASYTGTEERPAAWRIISREVTRWREEQ